MFSYIVLFNKFFRLNWAFELLKKFGPTVSKRIWSFPHSEIVETTGELDNAKSLIRHPSSCSFPQKRDRIDKAWDHSIHLPGVFIWSTWRIYID